MNLWGYMDVYVWEYGERYICACIIYGNRCLVQTDIDACAWVGLCICVHREICL